MSPASSIIYVVREGISIINNGEFPFRDCREIEEEAIVIGSGISGGWAAKELSEKGLSVLVLEAGRTLDPARDYLMNAPAFEMDYRYLGDIKRLEWDDERS